MSWTLFFQLLILIFFVYVCTMAVVKMWKGKDGNIPRNPHL